MDQNGDHANLRAALDWQLAMGVDEAGLDAPVNRYALEAVVRKPAAVVRPVAAQEAPLVPRPEDCDDLPTLAAALEQVPTPLRDTARRFVFADGNPLARVMVVGEAPGRDEDIEGRPFVGRAGQLLDRMLAAIGLGRMAHDRGQAVYIANVLPWRPENNRTPEPAEIALFLPWLDRHIALANPDFLVLMGNTPCQALLGRGAITRIRGQWATVAGRPALPMFHPAYLLRNPAAKREAWADLLSLKQRLRS
jgi:uracil-DNA glycosylase